MVCLTHWNESPSGKLLGLQPQHPASGLVCGRHINVYWMMERKEVAGLVISQGSSSAQGRCWRFWGRALFGVTRVGTRRVEGTHFPFKPSLEPHSSTFSRVVLCPRSAPIRTLSPLSVPGELCITLQVAAQLLLSPGHLLEPSLDWFRAPPLCSHSPCPPQPRLCGRHYLLVCLSHRL